MRLLRVLIVVTQISTLLCFDNFLRVQQASKVAKGVFDTYWKLYITCIITSMPHERFMSDNLHSYINAFSKTTVGHAPQFTANRKFFANMISTPAFKKTLMKDIRVLQNNLLEKIKFCDESVVNQDILKQLYDREVDQTKL
ncbi:uncharacterized protein LOC125065378 [Vanessa atalanta]|uniref:uncharacterized protein LOC125065378 n=1 Tax=Vanessa atalanta TaxID=42275 RepID=UPI001FCD3421|nr:uncharacterized protein LOC125065378 [Vanessa atalanta]